MTTRWFRPYVVTSANDNETYHLGELDGTRMAVPMARKRIKAFKKRHEDEPDLESMDRDDDQIGGDGETECWGRGRQCGRSHNILWRGRTCV